MAERDLRQEAKDRVDRMLLHMEQVEQGLIPADSPPDFVRPTGEAAHDDKGLPWWFGPDYHPTPEALEEFAKPMDDTAS